MYRRRWLGPLAERLVSDQDEIPIGAPIARVQG
jgi:hypothetical protein